jgi:hypothetical protein
MSTFGRAMTIKALTTQLERQQFGVRLLALILALVVSGTTVGCGGGAGSMPTNAVPAGASITRVNIADAPSDRVVSFEVTVGPITLTATDNSSVTVLSGTRRVEISHLSGTPSRW